MAIQVVSDQPERFNEVVCPKCRYRLRYTPADVKERQHTDYTGESDTYYSITCPRSGCGLVIDLSYAQAH